MGNDHNSIIRLLFFLQLISESKSKAIPTHSGDLMVSDQIRPVIGYQEVISNQGEEGPGPLRLTLTPGFLPTCLSCPRGEKRFLASALLLRRLPLVRQYRAGSSCVGAPAPLLSYR